MHHHPRPVAHAPNLAFNYALGQAKLGTNLVETMHAIEELEHGQAAGVALID